MKNIIRIALGTTVAALGVVAFTPNANAQSVDVDFTGTIPVSCTIGSQSAGTLLLTAPRMLASGGPGGGAKAAFTANCNAPASVKITSISANGSSYTAESVGALVWKGSTGLIFAAKGVAITNGVSNDVSGGGTQGVAAGLDDYTVSLEISNAALPLPVGSYNTRVSVLFAAP